jgi:hypothetical protein
MPPTCDLRLEFDGRFKTDIVFSSDIKVVIAGLVMLATQRRASMESQRSDSDSDTYSEDTLSINDCIFRGQHVLSYHLCFRNIRHIENLLKLGANPYLPDPVGNKSAMEKLFDEQKYYSTFLFLLRDWLQEGKEEFQEFKQTGAYAANSEYIQKTLEEIGEIGSIESKIEQLQQQIQILEEKDKSRLTSREKRNLRHYYFQVFHHYIELSDIWCNFFEHDLEKAKTRIPVVSKAYAEGKKTLSIVSRYAFEKAFNYQITAIKNLQKIDWKYHFPAALRQRQKETDYEQYKQLYLNATASTQDMLTEVSPIEQRALTDRFLAPLNLVFARHEAQHAKAPNGAKKTRPSRLTMLALAWLNPRRHGTKPIIPPTPLHESIHRRPESPPTPLQDDSRLRRRRPGSQRQGTFQ